MQFEDGLRSSRLVQPIDILSDDRFDQAGFFKFSQRLVSRVRARGDNLGRQGRSQAKKRSGRRRKTDKDATSIGLSLFHSPRPCDLKSGMPEGVEIPAPVRATACCEDRNKELAL